MTAEFEAFKDRYQETVQESISFAGQDVEFFTEAKARHLLSLTRTRLGPTSSLKALDVGCGVGLTDRLLASEIGELHGVDVADGIIARAASENPSVRYRTYDGISLPYEDGSHDLVFAICVLHHVPPARWPQFMSELARVTRPGGLVAIYEHNPLNPLTQLAVHRCEFDADAVLAGQGAVSRLMRRAGLSVEVRDYILFFPSRSRILSAVEHALAWLPLGAQHCVAGRR